MHAYRAVGGKISRPLLTLVGRNDVELVTNSQCAYRDEEHANWPLLVRSERLSVIVLREED
jgi:hypothetical protein